MGKIESAICFTAALLIATSFAAESQELGSTPQFKDYPVSELFIGKPAPVNLDSHPGARRFRTVLREAAKRGPNFAGHLTVVMWD